jgi:hypothetical protein
MRPNDAKMQISKASSRRFTRVPALRKTSKPEKSLAIPFGLALAQARLLKGAVRKNRPSPAGGAADGAQHHGQRGKTMSNQRTQTSGNANHHAVVAALLPCLLIGQFLWNVLTPAHESQMRSAQVMTMTVEALMLVGLFGLRASMPKPLFWIVLVAGLGLFALRLTGDDGCWTGHLVYTLPSR